MNANLDVIYRQTLGIFERDSRVLGAWEFGSLGKGTGDEYSDVDPVFVVNDADFDQIDAELRSLFEQFSDNIVLWWPEGFNSADIKNYAILLKSGDLLQYDMTIAKESSVREGFGNRLLTGGPVQILFDKTGLLQSLLDAAPPKTYSPQKLRWDIERYWVYVYIHAKYLKRNDRFKLLYAQQVLFQNHLDILKALHPHDYWGWWPWSVKNVLSTEKQEQLLIYFTSTGRETIAQALRQELDIFAADARAACKQWGVDYPDDLETEIRVYLSQLHL